MKKLICTITILSSLFFSTNSVYSQHRSLKRSHLPSPVSADEALKKLIDGNRRFVRHQVMHPHESIKRRLSVATKGQHPFAVVLSCSDSRVPPELVFDEGLGNLFVIRIAGNIADDAVIGSIEYAVKHLGISLVIVLGHEGCGAITAVLEGESEAHLASIIHAIQPAVENVKKKEPNNTDKEDNGQLHDKVLRENVIGVTTLLKANKSILSDLVESNKLKIVSGYYNLMGGKVEIIGF